MSDSNLKTVGSSPNLSPGWVQATSAVDFIRAGTRGPRGRPAVLGGTSRQGWSWRGSRPPRQTRSARCDTGVKRGGGEGPGSLGPGSFRAGLVGSSRKHRNWTTGDRAELESLLFSGRRSPASQGEGPVSSTTVLQPQQQHFSAGQIVPAEPTVTAGLGLMWARPAPGRVPRKAQGRAEQGCPEGPGPRPSAALVIPGILSALSPQHLPFPPPRRLLLLLQAPGAESSPSPMVPRQHDLSRDLCAHLGNGSAPRYQGRHDGTIPSWPLGR